MRLKKRICIFKIFLLKIFKHIVNFINFIINKYPFIIKTIRQLQYSSQIFCSIVTMLSVFTLFDDRKLVTMLQKFVRTELLTFFE
jgi:site-specific DNA-adenine methylase